MRSIKYLKNEAIRLRRAGKSYSEICKLLGVKSKGTLSLWFRDIQLSAKSNKLLSDNLRTAHERGLFNANLNRRKRIIVENSAAKNVGRKEINDITLKDLLLIGVALYWAEGLKSERTTPTLSFSNSDSYMISVYLRFLREVLLIPEIKIRAGIHIYSSISKEDAVRYWASITKLPEDRFYVVTQISRASSGKRPFNILKYGTAVIKVNSRVQFHKVKGMIEGMIQKVLVENR